MSEVTENKETMEVPAEETKVQEQEAPAETADAKKENFSAEKPEEHAKPEKVKKEKKPRKPFFFDTATSRKGLVGRCVLIFLHTAVIALAVLWLFGGLELLVNSNPAAFSGVYPFANAAMHGLIGMCVAFAYGIARIVCVIVQYNKKKK